MDNRFLAIFENASIGIALMDRQGNYTQVNDRFSTMLGYSHAELRKLSYPEIAHPDDRKAVQHCFQVLLRGKTNGFQVERRFVRKDGEIFLGEMAVTRLPDAAKTPGAEGSSVTICVLADITGQKWLEEVEYMGRITAEELATSLQASIAREQQVNAISELISSNLDSDSILQHVVRLAVQAVQASGGVISLFAQEERTADRIYPYNAAGMEALLPFTDRDDPICKEMATGNPLFLPHMRWLEGEKSAAAQEGIWKGLLPKLRLVSISSLICVPLLAWREPQGMLLLVSTDPDVAFTERDFSLAQSIGRSVGIALQNAHLYEKIQNLTMRDPLTGVFNRRHFFEMVKDDLKRCQRYKTPLSIIMLDLDHFKRVNDTYGFAAGDQVLQVIARRCSQELRSMDKVTRYGGEEFAILLPETAMEGAHIAAERLCKRIADSSIEVQDALVFVTASMGVTGTDGTIANMDVETLLGQADQALFFAKQNGGKRVCVWQETLLGAGEGFGAGG